MNHTTSYDRLKPERLVASLFVASQYLLPHHLLSSLMYRLTRIESPAFKNTLIRKFIGLYGVEMAEAMEPDPSRYRSFNDFFTRALQPDARPVSQDEHNIVCPADGVLSQAGDIEDGYLFQAKGHDYALLDLLGGDMPWSRRFEEGSFATIYLSPKDYHRVHMPYSGTLKKMIHVPGRLFSVNDTTTRRVPGLFARNERVICLFETDLGPMAVILVGAIFVASIETVWAGVITPVSRQVRRWDYPPDQPEAPIRLDRGEELGRFNMGSTVILLFAKDRVDWSEELEAGQAVKMGQGLGHRT
jgi:phosphatidylserine decarboxylase